eukprot:512083-Pyramimonas_sp.AAC.2
MGNSVDVKGNSVDVKGNSVSTHPPASSLRSANRRHTGRGGGLRRRIRRGSEGGQKGVQVTLIRQRSIDVVSPLIPLMLMEAPRDFSNFCQTSSDMRGKGDSVRRRAGSATGTE